MELLAKGDMIVPQDILSQAGLSGLLQIIVDKGEIRILAKKQTDSEKILDELAGCLGNESANKYDFGLKRQLTGVSSRFGNHGKRFLK